MLTASFIRYPPYCRIVQKMASSERCQYNSTISWSVIAHLGGPILRRTGEGAPEAPHSPPLWGRFAQMFSAVSGPAPGWSSV